MAFETSPPSPRRGFAWLLALNFFVSFLLYARSLPYEFVYDDHNRVEANPGIETLWPLSRFFTDPKTQANDDTLPRHTYRPLTTLSFAVDHALWKKRPAWYRFENVGLHALNGALLGYIGLTWFGLTWPAALVSGLLFVVHPLQSEAVAWVSGRSDVLSLTWLLLAWIFWNRFRSTRTWLALSLAVATFSAGLLTREIAVCFPVMVMLSDRLHSKADGRIDRRGEFACYGLFIAMALLYMVLRAHVIGQFQQIGYWGGTLSSNLANVMNVWSLYLQKIAWPTDLRVTYFTIPVLTGWSLPALMGLFSFGVFAMSAGLLWKIKREISVGLLLFVVFWAPGSNLVPVAALFADRLAYAPIAFLALAMGGALTVIATRRWVLVMTLVLTAAFVSTWLHLPAWKNDAALWTNAVRYEPENFSAWYLKGSSEIDLANRIGNDADASARLLLSAAKQSYRRSLNFEMPASYAGAILIHLAITTHRLGETVEAQSYAGKGLRLRPDLQHEWDQKRPPAPGG